MKKIFLALMAVAAICMVSCKKDSKAPASELSNTSWNYGYNGFFQNITFGETTFTIEERSTQAQGWGANLYRTTGNFETKNGELILTVKNQHIEYFDPTEPIDDYTLNSVEYYTYKCEGIFLKIVSNAKSPQDEYEAFSTIPMGKTCQFEKDE
ncbi:MAG: hypothetical protein MJZ48_04815 [Paludibacteraceae bacterium]|nr:hypothetical protein [Paludibacteraceae bacterium]